MFNSYRENTLKYNEEECINCGMCSKVCPHAVFARGEKAAVLANKEACMECGACYLNCPTEAIDVESGVGLRFRDDQGRSYRQQGRELRFRLGGDGQADGGAGPRMHRKMNLKKDRGNI